MNRNEKQADVYIADEVIATSSAEEVPTRTGEIAVPFSVHPSTLFAGLRQTWIDGSRDGVLFTLTSGAGVGSRYLVFTAYGYGAVVIDVTELVPLLFDALVTDVGSTPQAGSQPG